MVVFVLQHYLPKHSAAFQLHTLPCCTPAFLFLAQTDTIWCYVHSVQILNVLSAFINKNSSCDPYLQKEEKKQKLLPPNQPYENVKP